MRGDAADGGSVFAGDDVRDVWFATGGAPRCGDVMWPWLGLGEGVRKPEWGAVSVSIRYGRNGSIMCRQSTAYISSSSEALSHE